MYIFNIYMYIYIYIYIMYYVYMYIYIYTKFQNLIKMRCGGSAVLEWAISFQTPFHTVPYPFQTQTTHVPPLTRPWANGISKQFYMVANG